MLLGLILPGISDLER